MNIKQISLFLNNLTEITKFCFKKNLFCLNI